ncbi:MAG: PAS domain S-box protein [Geobacteraceae bacterium]|nr:PAS domain S-box protein [Geobacteraceae bacterium]
MKNGITLRVTLIYFVISSLWIYLTDRLLPRFAETATEITTLATYKGLFFIAATSFFLYLGIHYFTQRKCNRCLSILEAIDDAVFIYDLDSGAILDANRKACEIFGYGGKTEQSDLAAAAKHDPHSGWNTPREWYATAAVSAPQTFECQPRKKGGSQVWLEVKLQKIPVNGIMRLIAVARDISERKRSEQSLKRLNRTLRMLLSCNEVLTNARSEQELFESVCRTIVDDGFYRYAWIGLAENNEDRSVRPVAHAGISLDSPTITDLTWRDTDRGRGPTGSALREGVPCLVRDARNDMRFLPWREEACCYGYQSVLSVPLVHGDTVFAALTVCASEPDAFDDEETNLMGQLAEDMAFGIASLKTTAERKLMEDALVKTTQNLAEAQSIASLGSWEYDLETDEEYRSEEFFRILGLVPQQNGRATDSVFDYIHPDDRALVLRKITETLEGGKLYDVEYRIIRADGSERLLHAQGKTMRDSAGKTTKFIGTACDITERKLADTALRESEHRFRSLVETTTDWIWEMDENSVYVYSSPKIRDLLGYEAEEVIGKTPFDLMHPQDALRLAEAFTQLKEKRQPIIALENINIHKNGSLVTIETSAMPIFDEQGAFCGYRGIDRDVTDRKKLEEKYLQAQKMEAVGQLAGGIAHDFNNILTAVIGFQHLLMQIIEGEKPRHYASQVLLLAEKASNLIRDLLTISRKQTVQPKHMDVNETITRIGKILKRLIGEDIELHIGLHEKSLPILAVTGHLEQVLMNLATNARDAMPEGGMLTIKTETVNIDRYFVLLHRQGEAGRYALISFSDTGLGMDEATRLRVFEPFFTTKEVGKGTGLGLSTVYGIIHQHGGFVTVYSEPGEGTTFRIYLPLAKSGEPEPSEVRGGLFPPNGRETVLLAEDEPEVRQVMSSLLSSNGYRVVLAVDGEDAVERYLEFGDDIDLLVLDVIMPKKNGKQVYDIISRARTDIKTIFVSGYTADIVEQKGIPETCHLVSKPFSPHDFLWKVREVLDGVSGFVPDYPLASMEEVAADS